MFSDDYAVLSDLRSRLEIEYKNRRSVDRYVLGNFMHNLDGAIKRASGYNDAIDL